MKYSENRKGRYYSDDHPTSARQRRLENRRRRVRRANLRDEAFGKVNWNVYTHRQLWQMIMTAEPSTMGAQARRWGQVAKDIDESTEAVQQVVQTLMHHWRGPSAVQAAASVSTLNRWATEAGQTARQVGVGLDDYTSAVSEAKARMPEPVHYHAERWFRQGYDVTTLPGPEGAYMMDALLDDHLPTRREADQAKAEAVRVMEQYESASRQTHDSLPQPFAAAPQVAAPDAGGGVAPVPPAAAVPAPAVPAPVLPGPGGGTTASSTAPLPGQLPVGGVGALAGGVSGSVPGGGLGAGGFGAGGGPFGAGVSGVFGGAPSAGGPRSGAVPGGVVGAAGGRGGAGMAGARGGTGTGMGVYPPGGGAGRDEDGEHRNRYDTGMDLMDDLPAAYPSVLGE